jgi:gluconolactonase
VTSLSDPIVPTDRIDVVWYGRIDHAEGLAVAADRTVWCGGEAGQIYVGQLDGEPRELARLPGRTLGFCLDAAGNAYCADMDGPGLYRITPEGRVNLVSSGTREQPAQAPNHPAFLPSGHLVYTDSGDWGEGNGRIYSVSPEGTTSVADTSACRFPNGLAVSPDGGSLVVVESTLPGVSVLPIGADGELGERRVLVEMPETVPDGVAYDADGRLLVSCYVPDAVFQLEPDGQLSLLVHDPLRLAMNQPTNIAFVPGTKRLVAANIGERFLSVFEHTTEGAELLRPEFRWRPEENAG